MFGKGRKLGHEADVIPSVENALAALFVPSNNSVVVIHDTRMLSFMLMTSMLLRCFRHSQNCVQNASRNDILSLDE